MQRVLQSWQGILPPILYVQLDIARENKNSTVFGYLSMLVEKDIFKKVKLNFLLVGDTHDHINQMFSRFSKQLARSDAFYPSDAIEVDHRCLYPEARSTTSK
mgnify:FL=1